MEQFYSNVSEKRIGREEMRLQVDQEFQPNDVKKLNTEFDIRIFSTMVREGKAFADKQKIREF